MTGSEQRIVAARDERPHPPGPEPLWNEAWGFEWSTPAGHLGGFVRLGLYPNRGVAWYWACLAGEDRTLVIVLDHDVPLPRAGLEVRTEGLWAAHNLETPLDHWSLGCEAFAVGTDDGAEVDGDLRGERVPFGHDLEWETDGPVIAAAEGGRYAVPCRVTGEVLVGHEQIEVDGPGWRDHTWGVAPWWTSSWRRGWSADAGPPVAVDGEAGGRPVASVPVRLVAPDGRTSLLTRTLCRTDDGGVGWIEENRPPDSPF